MRSILASVVLLAAAAFLGQVLAFLPTRSSTSRSKGGNAAYWLPSCGNTFRPRTLHVRIAGSERPHLPRCSSPFRSRTLLVRHGTSFEIGSSEGPPTVPSVAPKQGYVYVLELEGDEHHDNYYYVGFTQNVGRRLRAHFEGDGSRWTKMHPPCSVMEVSEGGLLEERHKTIEIMKTYGWVKTRGSYWSSTVMTVPPRELRVPNERYPVSAPPTSRREEEGPMEGRREEGQDVSVEAALPHTGCRRTVFRTLRTLATLAAVTALTAALGVAIRAR